MRRVIWTEAAKQHVLAIRAYVGLSRPLTARRLAERLIAAGNSLAQFPDRGRPRSGGVRELLSVPPYAIRYRVTAEAVFIVRVRHGARRPSR